MPKLAPHHLPDYLLSTGQNTFSTSDAKALLPGSDGAVRKGLERLTRAGQIFSPSRGFYVVIPAEFRLHRSVPASHFIDAMMRALDRRYYVSLVSAAELHGATEPTHDPRPFHVMVDRHVADRDPSNTSLRFYASRSVTDNIGIEQHKGPTGQLQLASRELTAVDLVQHANACGGISTVAPLLHTLAPLHIRQLTELVDLRDRSTARRLGWLLTRLNPDLYLEPLRETAEPHRGTPTDLAAGGPRRGTVDRGWNVRVNTQPGRARP